VTELLLQKLVSWCPDSGKNFVGRLRVDEIIVTREWRVFWDTV